MDSIRLESDRLKHEWLVDQTKLVATAAATDELLEVQPYANIVFGIWYHACLCTYVHVRAPHDEQTRDYKHRDHHILVLHNRHAYTIT